MWSSNEFQSIQTEVSLSVIQEEQNTQVAALCDLIQRIWSHGRSGEISQARCSFWFHLTTYVNSLNTAQAVYTTGNATKSTQKLTNDSKDNLTGNLHTTRHSALDQMHTKQIPNNLKLLFLSFSQQSVGWKSNLIVSFESISLLENEFHQKRRKPEPNFKMHFQFPIQMAVIVPRCHHCRRLFELCFALPPSKWTAPLLIQRITKTLVLRLNLQLHCSTTFPAFNRCPTSVPTLVGVERSYVFVCSVAFFRRIFERCFPIACFCFVFTENMRFWEPKKSENSFLPICLHWAPYGWVLSAHFMATVRLNIDCTCTEVADLLDNCKFCCNHRPLLSLFHLQHPHEHSTSSMRASLCSRFLFGCEYRDKFDFFWIKLFWSTKSLAMHSGNMIGFD